MRTKIEQRTIATDCGVEAALELIGGKWKGVILYHLQQGELRFNQLARLLPRVTQRMLTRQLRELELDGLVLRTVYPEVPPKVEYRLSPKGQSLNEVVMLLKRWGETYVLDNDPNQS
jgi:DNA-binding HxlR family transcriptional regulator